MPDLRTSSLPPFPFAHESPYRDWIQLARTEQEWLKLLRLFQGLPRSWLEWVDTRAVGSVERGVDIRHPLDYRLTNLWKGIVLLQEAKFISDWMELALREGLMEHMAAQGIHYLELEPTVPDDPKTEQLWLTIREDPDNYDSYAATLITSLSFYQLTETMARNWRKIKREPRPYRGFNSLFKQDQYCRSAEHFGHDMKIVRLMRNDIAHTKRLFDVQEVIAMYEIICRWLTPLQIDLSSRISTYRDLRPKFLDDLGLTERLLES